MNRAFSGMLTAALLVVATPAQAAQPQAAPLADAQLERLTHAFYEYSGARLVFSASQLPTGPFFDVMPELPPEKRIPAAMLLCHEVQKYPPQFLGKLNLKAVGVFKACAFKKGDGFHAFDKQLQGYRYFGLNNNKDGMVAAYYTDEQLPLTFHHEIFHSVDRLAGGGSKVDSKMAEILQGKAVYPPLVVEPTELSAIKKSGGGKLLEGAVSAYAAKNPDEDKAETARYLMCTLPDCLAQAVERPQMAGSQRILHVLNRYRSSVDGKGPGLEWFAALAAEPQRIAAPDLKAIDPKGLAVLVRLRRLTADAGKASSNAVPADPKQSREILEQAASIAGTLANSQQADQIARLAADLMMRRGENRIQSQSDGTFVVRGAEDAAGVNWTLRNDVAEIGQDADQFKRIAESAPANRVSLAATQIKLLRLVAGYYTYIARNWRVTDGTRKIFEETRNQLAASLPQEQSALAVAIMQTDLNQLAQALSAAGQWNPQPAGGSSAPDEATNPYLANVDAEVKDPNVRTAIRLAQPACVRIGTASGVTVTAGGCVLTAAHVVHEINMRSTVLFPDGQKFMGNCIAIDKQLDLALCQVFSEKPLPFARLALDPPTPNTSVICIGQPGSATPDGELTGYKPFHVSTGRIVGFREDQLDDQRLGGAKHDAWTYWGHSGSPLFNEQGEIVALHNSWDPQTRMRHAVMHEAIAWFLQEYLPKASRPEVGSP